MTDNPELELADKFVKYTNRNIFLTGKAGTGKTTFLHKLKGNTHKRMVVVAPTGVAAINAGGVTIHSFFQLPFGPILTERLSGNKMAAQKYNKTKINIIKSLDLLVIDEISMVRADLLDGIDEVLRRFRNRELPFGGVQLLMIGDLQQLAPVVKNDERQILSPYYDTMFFFSSKALQASDPISLELKHIYRQNDQRFINILNQIRDNRLTKQGLDELHKRYIPNFSPKKEDGYITLTTHNASADRVNDEELENIKGKKKHYRANVTGTFPEYSYPTDYDLYLKEGAQVMFVKNDSKPEKRFFNGKIGTIIAITSEYVRVECKDDKNPIFVEKEEWHNYKYTINKESNEIEEEVIGTFTQYPLRLAWAITIHKSQGLTFEKAIIDAHAAFAHGQTYVALSRCKTLEGLVLSSKISSSAIICDQSVSSFNERVKDNQPDHNSLKESEQAYQLFLITELFNYKGIQHYINRCIRELQENDRNIQGDLLETMNRIQQNIIPELIAVSQKFQIQVKQLIDLEETVEFNTKLQERIIKACQYFLGKTQEEICRPLKESSFSSDNKTVKKAIKETLQKLNESLNIKSNCLDAGTKGFDTREHLRVRANAVIQNSVSKSDAQPSNIDKMADHPELFRRLSSWRKETAHQEDIAPYRIASQKVLLAICTDLPSSLDELKEVNGIGAKKIKDYGTAIIHIVTEYCDEKGIETHTLQRMLLM